jgi:hypothetical protein
MKTKLTTLLLALTASFAFAHGGVELGPNGGRILEFSKNETMHGEVTVKDGKFLIALLDKDMKPVATAAQTLTATTGTGAKPEKLTVEKTATGFSLPVIKDGGVLIVQFRESEKTKLITARLTYDTANCEECSNPEWLCKCAAKKEEAKDAPKKEAPKKEAPVK